MMSSWMLLLLVSTVRSFTIHTFSRGRDCVDVQCPAGEVGITQLVDEETLTAQQCSNCNQCTTNGYSMCLRMHLTRARRDVSCSCSHSVPANCHNEVATGGRPANQSMRLFNICYLSSLQAPPKPLAVNEKAFVIVTLEPFWQEPYWRDLHLSNLTLHYQFPVATPEHCDGEVESKEIGEHVTHMCENKLNIEMSGGTIDDKKKKKEHDDDEYEHSENYDNYDDELPPEVQFDREVFANARETRIFYTVNVFQPRQLVHPNQKDPFRDVNQIVESDILQFDLNYVKPEEKKELTKAESQVEEDEEDETGDFFKDERKSHRRITTIHPKDVRTTTEKTIETTEAVKEEVKETEKKDEEQKEVEEKEVEETKDENDILSTLETATEQKKEESEEKEEIKEEEKEDQKEEEKEEAKEMEEEKVEDEKEEESEKKMHDKATQTSAELEKNAADTKKDDDEKSAEEIEQTPMTEEEQDDRGIAEEKVFNEGTSDNDDEEADEEEKQEPKKNSSFVGRLSHDRFHLARVIFGVTLVVSVIFTILVCIFKRKSFCCAKKDTKVSAGYTYNAANQTTRELVSTEHSRLNQ